MAVVKVGGAVSRTRGQGTSHKISHTLRLLSWVQSCSIHLSIFESFCKEFVDMYGLYKYVRIVGIIESWIMDHINNHLEGAFVSLLESNKFQFQLQNTVSTTKVRKLHGLRFGGISLRHAQRDCRLSHSALCFWFSYGSLGVMVKVQNRKLCLKTYRNIFSIFDNCNLYHDFICYYSILFTYIS